MLEQLFQISAQDAARFAGIDPLLLGASEASAGEQLRALVEVIGGRRTLGALLDQALASKEYPDALLLGAVSLERGVVSADQRAALETMWRERREEYQRLVASLDGLPDALREASPEYQSILQELNAKVQALDVPEPMPLSRVEMERALGQIDFLPALRADLDTLRELARDDIERRQAQVLEKAQAAFERICREIAKSGFDPGSPAARVLWAVPSLVLAQRTSTLERLATPDISLAEEAVLAELAPDRRPRAREAQRPGGEHQPRERLSGPSQAILQRVRRAERVLADDDGLRALEMQESRLRGAHELAALWLGANLSARDPTLAQLALARGLYWSGRQHLETSQYRVAAEILKDALAISSSVGAGSDSRAEQSAVALLAARCWPKRLARRHAGARITDWLDAPRALFDWLVDARSMETFGSVWADLETDSAAKQLLEIAQLHSTDFALVERACAAAITSAHKLTTDPELAIGRIKLLVPDASAPVYAALDEAALALGGLGGGRGTGAIRACLQAQAEVLRNEIDAARASNETAGEEMLSIVAGRLEDLAAAAGDPAEARLSVQPNAKTFYPEERSDDVQLSITIRNAEGGKALGNVAAQVAVVGEAAEAGVRLDGKLQAAERPLDSLEAGAVRTVSFALSLPDKAESRLAEVRFKARVLWGTAALLDETFSVAVRPGSRSSRKSPFTTGTAVVGESFVGREHELKLLTDALTGDAERVPVVVGIRRIGKTSILERLVNEEEVRRRWVAVRFSLEDRPDSDTTELFLQYVCERIHSALPRAAQEKVHFRRDEFRADPYLAFERFSESLPLVNGKRVLAVFDEFDRIIHLAARAAEAEQVGVARGPREAFQPQVFGALRKVLMRPVNLRMVFAGLPAIMHASYKDRLFGLLDPIKIDRFTEREADQVVKAASGVFSMSGLSKEKLYAATGLQPYLLQLCCHKLFTRMSLSGRDVVTPDDVQEVLDDLLENEAYFTDYVSLIDRDRRPLLRALAAAQRDASRIGLEFAPVQTIARELVREGGAASSDEVRATLKAWSEEERPLVRQAANSRNRFQLVIGLLGEHLLREGTI